MLYIVFGGYFLGAMLWFLNRWTGGAFLAVGAMGTLLSPLLLENLGLYFSNLFVSLVCGAALGFRWFGRRQSSAPISPTKPAGPIKETQGTSDRAHLRLMIGVIFWFGALTFCVDVGRGPSPMLAGVFALLFFSLGGIFLPGSLLLRIIIAGVLAGLATIVGFLLGPTA